MLGQIGAPVRDALQRVEPRRCLAADTCSGFTQKPHSLGPNSMFSEGDAQSNVVVERRMKSNPAS